jgi:glycosyltransferase involved in cell wall biosynthesis
MKAIVVSNMAESLVNFRGPLIRELRAAGHEVVAVAPEATDPVVEVLADRGVRYVSIPMARTSIAPLDDLTYARRLFGLFRRERPDVVFAYTIKPTVYATVAARLAGVPTRVAMVNGLGYAFGSAGMRQKLVGMAASLLYRAAGAAATEVVFQNPDDRDEFTRRGLVPARKTRVVAGSGIDLARFEAQPLPEGAPTFLLIARLIRDKGVVDFVDAARIVRERHPEARFQLLGPLDPGAPGAIDQATLDAWAAEGVVAYLGTTRDVRPLLAAATVFVLPSYYREGTPRTALEALATGRAVVTTDLPGCRETVVDGENGDLVPARDPQALAAALTRYVVEPDRARRFGASSRALAESKFDVHRVNADMRDAMGLGGTA